MVPELKLAELLCTRLCHDITGPVGAIANGAEFLSEESSDMQGQAIELIASSAAQAVSRLQFYRKAYGRINDDGEADLAEQKKIIGDFFTGSKVTLDWPDTHTNASGVSISGKMGRLLYNAVIIAQATLLRGGSLAVRITENDNTKEIQVSTSGVSIKWDKEIEDALSGRIALMDLTPKTVQAEMTRYLAKELNSTLSWQASDSGFTLTIHQQMMQGPLTEV